MKAFPLFLTVQARSLVVFGGGEEAAAKLRLLLKTEAQVIAVASAFEPAVSELEGLTLVRQNPLCFAFPSNTPFAYAATGDEELDADLARKARHAGVLVCAADQPAVSDFSTPALVDRDPVVIAIGTEGTAPVLARSIKAQIEFMLEPSLGLIAKTAAGLRDQVARTLKPGQPRRDFWRAFFSTARTERLSSAQAVETLGNDLLTAPAQSQQAGSLTIVGTGAGEADLLAIAGHRALDTAAVVLYEPLVARSVLELARREATFQVLELNAFADVLRHVAAGHQVVRLVSGDGTLAADEHKAAQAAGLKVRLIPGLNVTPDTASTHPPSRTQRAALPPYISRKAA
jgi:uroporphyrin-III C-methyltransferase / precorrin-2 dehydrogenase / sirohydrochlorin ferrochelatase